MAASLRLPQAGDSVLKKGFQFYLGALPSDYRYAFTAAVFNTPCFRALQSAEGWLSFYVLHPKTSAVHAHMHVHLGAGIAVTPLRAPFGSIETSPVLAPEMIFDFLEFVESKLGAAGASQIIIRNPPDAYDPGRAGLVNSFLIMRGYTVVAADVGSVIPVTSRSFADGLHARKKRKLNQSKGHAFHFAALQADELQSVYDFIRACRHTKGYPLSVTFDDLRHGLERCPGAYVLFGVYAKEELVAASVATLVNDRILYHFISDHTRKTGVFSPALVLMEGIYDYCVQKDLAILDLGTSVIAGKPNFKLLNFKRELGAMDTAKFTFSKTLAS